MKYEPTENEDIKLNMTSMIDIVFQLLVFFILTFKVVVQEGDYNVRMPIAAVDTESMDEPPELIRVMLRAGETGAISTIEVDDEVEVETLAGDTTAELYAQLNDYIDAKVSAGNDPESGVETEVEFDIDSNLKYRFTVQAIEAVSGKQLADGNVKKLVENIKLKDNSQQ
ncbi:ExbD/TolR family protein [Mariniblastus fucicola]|uniref:Biopolymer transport protein ExbD/TolR n=1 Tax=Mariniblastus fucicola TaxID=980251 RepID=A0A5B9PDE5_9BACT|nr:biopolymer transporter ExbD [Mariniblastus fucicola]QEG24717.1 Biopolymer transport protein ExbD/TolR [Mariniblastus fucicola]